MFRYWVIIVATIFVAVVIGQVDDSCEPSPTKCSFYEDCLDALFPCGPNGYALRYGLYYCNKFHNNENLYSSKGKQWISSTALCLQEALLDRITTGEFNSGTTCTEIENIALKTHEACYTNTNTSICDIPITDWAITKIIVKDALTDPKTWETIINVAGLCGEKYAKLLANYLTHSFHK